MVITPLHGLGFAALALFVAWRLYRRYRSHLGPQKVRPLRMSLRVALFSAFAVLLLLSPVGPLGREVAAAAIALGGGLGWLSLNRTRFEARDGRHWYTPNVYIGLAVTALLVVRLVYRLVTVYPLLQAGVIDLSLLGPFSGRRSVSMLALFGLAVGYYAIYYGGVLLRSRQLGVAVPAEPAA